MNIDSSVNLRKFKKEIGQANHFLITILIGLDGVKDGCVELKKEFSTSWKPKDKKISAQRSRIFAKKSALSWIVDNLDMYFMMCNEEPKLIQNKELIQKLDSAGQSVYQRFRIFSDFYAIEEVEKAFVDLMICWRNRLIHYKANNDILKESREMLMIKQEFIRIHYNGLNVSDMLCSFDASKEPSFKELTSMIKAIIQYVYKLDNIILKGIDLNKFVDKLLYSYIKTDSFKRLNNIFSRDLQTKESKLRTILKNSGFNDDYNKEVEDFIKKIILLNYNEAKMKYLNGTFI